ncbi:MAG: PorT family protein [Bacteroidaceae bacterium]|nr:PorT family protein [Bacteroidaceae bacterium]
MKRIIPVILTLLLSTTTYAQIEEPRNILEIGVAGGLNMSQLDVQPNIRQKYQKGLNGGISLRYTTEKYFKMICAAQLEVNFSQRGWEEDFDDDTGNSYKRTLNYVEIPFFAHLAFGKEPRGFQFFINLGPQIGFFLSEEEEYIGTWSPELRPAGSRYIYGKNVENKFEYGIAGGLGVELKTKVGNFIIEGRYYYGLSDIYGNSKTDDYGRSANNTITARLGYSIPLFKE